jgi:multicomponent K+:H+ antiporter subunit D
MTLHAIALPILIPLAAAIVLLLANRAGLALSRVISLASLVALVVLAAYLLTLAADGEVRVYRLGNWPAPYGIVLVLDRLSAIMVAVTAVLALAVLLYASDGTDGMGRHFHPLLQLQIAGLTGAFLTGDIFNLFVFFEVLLLASYAQLVHGGGLERIRAGLGYVILNITGSTVFLAALGLLYGTLGTLNMADMAVVLPQVPPQDQALVRAALALLVAVLLLKAAVLPLGFWLPHVYAAASAPVAALFAVMTKVGVYALLRLSATGLAAAPFTGGLLQPWLLPLAILTILIGAIGALAARRLAVVIANLVVVSTGTLLAAVAAGAPGATAAALYYLPHTTLVTAGLFLLGDCIARQRGALGDSLGKGPRLAGPIALGSAFLVLTLGVSGMPPLSGFVGKLMLMQSLSPALTGAGLAWAFWGALLLSGFAAALVLARAASAFFWEPGRQSGDGDDIPLASRSGPGFGSVLAVVLLTAASPLFTLAAAPVAGYARSAAEQLHARMSYVSAVLGTQPSIEREVRP